MAKVSGKSGLIRIGSAVNIGDANHSAGVVTVDTTAAHGLSARSRVIIESVVGMTDLNDHFSVATIPDTDSFTVALATAQGYTSGGTVQQIIEITNYSFTVEAPVIDTTDSESADSGYREKIPKGIKNFTGTIEGFLYTSTLKPTMGSELEAVLQTNGVDDYSGTIIITSDATTLDVPGEEAVKVSFNFEGTGELS